MTVADDATSLGDVDVLKVIERPNYAIAKDGRTVVHELENGRLQVRMTVGTMTDVEIKHFQKALSKRQEIFYEK